MVNRRKLIAGGLGAAIALQARIAKGDALSAPDAQSSEPGGFGFGWIPDLPDLQDSNLSAFPNFLAGLPPRADLSAEFPAPYSQGQIGSCTANVIAGSIQYARRKARRRDDWIPSRTFIYYYERLVEGKVRTDSGAQLRNGIGVIVEKGVPPEEIWPYDREPPDPITRLFPEGSRHIIEPTEEVKTAAAQFQTISYSPLSNNLEELKTVVASGYPFFFGFRVYSGFNGSTTRLSVPAPDEQATPWGHAVLVVGYDDEKQSFKIRNSWGSQSHSGGYFEMDYGYVSNPNLCRDFWVIYNTEALNSSR